MSRLIYIYAVCKSLLLSPMSVKEITYYGVMVLEEEVEWNVNILS